MSIVLSVCGTNFSLMMSDGRMMRLNDMSIVYERAPKIKRVNSKVIIGFTGDPIPMIKAIDELDSYKVELLTLERIKGIIIRCLKKQEINDLGVRLIISGKNKSNKFVTYTIDSRDNFNEVSYVFEEGFAVNYALPNDCEVNLKEICDKHICSTVPWKSIEQLKRHMRECIKEVSTLCDSVNDIVFEEIVI